LIERFAGYLIGSEHIRALWQATRPGASLRV
jgi:hypothetical protein